MPYVIRPGRKHLGVVGACSALLALGAGSAQAATPSETSMCEAPSLSQPFLSGKDSNYYTLAPGQSGENFQGTGWTLSGGAKIEQTNLPDGKTGSVLDMPSGSRAVSPVVCVTTGYPRARAMVHNVVGGDAVHFSVGYKGSNSWLNPQGGGDVHGHDSKWTLSDPLDMHPENVSGWQLVQITLVAGGDVHHPSDVQIDDLYIDPYSR